MRDGHHRVSVARALGHDVIDAYVTVVYTRVGTGNEIRLADLPLKSHERVFYERVPLPDAARDGIRLREPAWQYVAGGRVPAGDRDAARGRPDRRADRSEAYMRVAGER